MSKLKLKELHEVFVNNQDEFEQVRSASVGCSNAFNYLLYSHNTNDIEVFHYGMLAGLIETITRVNNSNMSDKEKQDKIQYLNLLKAKVEKAKDLMMLL
jgi:hypothetical protein